MGSEKILSQGTGSIRPMTAAELLKSGYGNEKHPQKSEAASTVELIESVMASLGEDGQQVTATSQQISDLMPYFTGKLPLPDETTEQGKTVRDQLALYQPELISQHLKGYKQWLGAKANKKAVADAEALQERWQRACKNEDEQEQAAIIASAKSGHLIPLGVPYSPEGSGATDLPDIPQSLRLTIERDGNLPRRALNAFLLGLNTASFKDDAVGKLCHAFAALFRDRNKAHIDAKDTKMRTQFDNAALALLSYGIVRPVVQKHQNRSGTTVESVGFTLNLSLLKRHAEVFLVREQYKRLGKAEAASTNKSEKGRLAAEMAKLEDAKKDADQFVANLRTRGIRKPRTIIEAFGNRLFVPAGDVPVFDTPQEADDAKGSGVSDRSLDVALKMLGARQTVVERIGTLHGDVETRAGQYRHVLDTETRFLGSLDENLSMFGIVVDDSLLPLARSMLRELLEHMNNVQEVSEACAAESRKRHLTNEKREQRTEQFAPIQELADQLLKTYSERMRKMMQVVSRGTHAPEGMTKSSESQELRETVQVLEEAYGYIITTLQKNLQHPRGVDREDLKALIEILSACVKK